MLEVQKTHEGHGKQAIYDSLLQRLLSGELAGGGPLTERAVAREFSVCRPTARQALRELVRSGHLQVSPRRGYWPSSPLVGTVAPRVACVCVGTGQQRDLGRHYTDILLAVNQRVLGQGGTVVTISDTDCHPGRLARRVRAEKVDGVILDCDSSDADAIADALGMPCILINTPTVSAQMDVVVQDNMTGGYLAASHFLDIGHRRVGWVGWQPGSAHARERLGSFLSSFAERGLPFDPHLMALVERGSGPAETEKAVKRLLAERPTAIAALWTDLGAWTARYIKQLGLGVPEDISLVTWGRRETFQLQWWECCEGQVPLPDAIEWGLEAMVDASLSRLVERKRNPLAAPAKILLPVSLETRGSCQPVNAEPRAANGGAT